MSANPLPPSPWRVERHKPISNVGRYSKPFFTIRDRQGCYVAAVDPFEGDEPRHQEVANLLAAAPDLLEVAKELAHASILTIDIVRRLKAAVRKAEGMDAPIA